MYDSLRPRELQLTRLPCPSLSKIYHIIYFKTEIVAKIYSLNVIEIRLLVSRVVFFFFSYLSNISEEVDYFVFNY